MTSPDFWLHVLYWWGVLSFTVFIILCIGAIRNERRNHEIELGESAEEFVGGTGLSGARTEARAHPLGVEKRLDSRDTKRLYTRLGR